MRPAQDPTGNSGTTPIYDALYAEYRRLFRTLPGDRTGEEDLGFTSFSTGPYGARQDFRHGLPPIGAGSYGSLQYGATHHGIAYHDPRLGQPARQHAATPGTWVPAALPPAPRRES
ncbi:hypothetical protein ACFVT5_36815 [Streptomyces sp. NPDC058001]|uniref:hypothetical protein n=1 Tax=Streptomyces sp. NPDC058001 TaxID=3346300 RepID=UPI0036E829E9